MNPEQLIIEYGLKNAENLELFLRIGNAVPQLRKRIDGKHDQGKNGIPPRVWSSQAIKQKLENLNTGLSTINKEELSPYFNSFNFWKKQIDEEKVSEILAFLLNPNESHDQGLTFLNIFLEHIGIFLDEKDLDKTDLRNVWVRTERMTDTRRKIDILITNKQNTFTIAIENKINHKTIDQINQISDYLKFLNQVNAEKQCFIYLAPKSKKLSNTSLEESEVDRLKEENKFKELNYEDDILKILTEFHEKCKSDKVRCFIAEFRGFISTYFHCEDMTSEYKSIIEYGLECDDNLDLLLSIGNLLPQLKEALREILNSQMKEIVDDLDNLNYNEDFAIAPNNWSKNSFMVYLDNENNALWGIHRNTPDKSKSAYTEIMRNIGYKWDVSEHWGLWGFIDRDINSKIDFWLSIKNGKLKSEIESIATVLVSKFNSYKY